MLTYSLLECGGVELTLTVGSDVVADGADLGLEAHVEHAVCLVQHQVGDPLQVGHLHLDHVDESPGRGDGDLRALLEGLALLVLVPASVRANHLKKTSR